MHAADFQDGDGAKQVLTKLLNRFPRLEVIWVDGAYGSRLAESLLAEARLAADLRNRCALIRSPRAEDHLLRGHR